MLALVEARVEWARLALARGDLATAGETLAAARTEARSAQRPDCEIWAHLVDTHRRCLLGDTAGASRAAAAAIALARDNPEGDSVRAVLLWLTQAAVYGLQADVLEEAREATGWAEDLPSLFGNLLAGAAVVATGAGSEALEATADALRQPDVGERHAELRILAGWFDAEGHRRADDAEGAVNLAKAALREADRLGHVWLQLCLLLLLQCVDRDPERERKATALIDRVAGDLSGAERDGFRSLWASRVRGQ